MGYGVLLRERQRKRDELRERTLAGVRRAGESLRARFVFEELYVFGSLLGPRFRLTSDVDLVIAGLDMRDFHRAHAYLMEAVGGPLAIDLKALEDLPKPMQQRVRAQGVRVA